MRTDMPSTVDMDKKRDNAAIDHFIHALSQDLQRDLPGQDAQYRLAPVPRHLARHGMPAPPDAAVNGVLILLYPHADELYLPLILRPVYPGVHSGQVSLPGGRMEELDGDVVNTALREAQEEVGVDPAAVRVLGQLTPLYIGASNNVVHPTVGYTDKRPDFQIDTREVDLLLETPLSHIIKPHNVRTTTRTMRGHNVTIPHYDVDGQMLWGATAMILAEMIALPAIQKLQRDYE